MGKEQENIEVACPCGDKHVFASAHAGRVARCPKLRKRFQIPSASGPVRLIEDAAEKQGKPASDMDEPKRGFSPGQITKAIVTRTADLYRQHKEKKELAKAEYDATHCRCPHCACDNLQTDYACKGCGCPLQDQHAAFLFMEKRRQEAHEIRLAELQIKANQGTAPATQPCAAPSPAPIAQASPPAPKTVVRVQQNVIVKGRRELGCLGSIVLLVVFVVLIVVCAGLFSTPTTDKPSGRPVPVAPQEKGASDRTPSDTRHDTPKEGDIAKEGPEV